MSLNIERLSCIWVAKESADAEDLVSAFGRFRILQDARRSIGNAATTFPGLEDKVDVLFCEREAEVAPQYAILASLKVNRQRFFDNVRDLLDFPIDLGITIETPRRRDVRWEEDLGIYVVHLPMNVASGLHVWGMATEIAERALIEGGRNRFLQFFRSLFRQGTPENYWVEFLADRLQADRGDVVQEIRQTLHQTPEERIVTVPVILGPEEDAVLELVTP